MTQRLETTPSTAFERLQQRRESKKQLQEIDKLLDDGLDALPAKASTAAETPRGYSFGSGRSPSKNRRYWLSKGSSTPGPGTYVVSKADNIIRANNGAGGALGPRRGGCCRFQPCECKKAREEADRRVEKLHGKRQESQQLRRSSPSQVRHLKPAQRVDFHTRERQQRVAAVQAAKQHWKRVGQNTTPNYRWTERRVATGGALSMENSTDRDGMGSSAVKARVRKLLIVDHKRSKCHLQTVATDASKRLKQSSSLVDMKKLSGRDSVRCKRKHERVVTAFDQN